MRTQTLVILLILPFAHSSLALAKDSTTLLERAKRHVVMLEAFCPGSTDSARVGAGVIVGKTVNQLLIATAYHVVERCDGSPAGHPIAELKAWVYEDPAMRSSLALAGSDTYSPRSGGHDVAMLAMPFYERDIKWVSELDFRILSPDVAHSGTPVTSIGYNGEIRWTSPNDELLRTPSDRESIQFKSQNLSEGQSGGALYNERWELLGIVQRVGNESISEALNIDRIIALAKQWGLPIGLELRPENERLRTDRILSRETTANLLAHLAKIARESGDLLAASAYLAASGEQAKTEHLWAEALLTPRSPLQLAYRRSNNKGAEFTTLAFSPTKDQLAVGTTGGEILICEGQSGTLLTVLRGPKRPITALAYDTVGQTIVAGLMSSDINDKEALYAAWDLSGSGSAEPVQIIRGIRAKRLAFLPNKSHLVLVSSGSGNELWDLKTGSTTRLSGLGHWNIIGDGQLITAQYQARSEKHNKKVIIFAPSSWKNTSWWQYKLRESVPKELKLPAPVQWKKISSWQVCKSNMVMYFRLSRAAPVATKHWAASPCNHRVVVINRVTGKQTILAGHGSEVDQLAWSPDGQWLATAGRDGTVRIWEPTYGSQVAMASGYNNGVFDVAFDRHSRMIATLEYQRDEGRGYAGTLRVWRFNSGDIPRQRTVLSKTTLAQSSQYCANVGLISVVNRPDELLIQVGTKRHIIPHGRDQGGAGLALGCGPSLAQYGSAGLRIWDLTGAQPVKRDLEISSRVDEVSFDRTGRRVAWLMMDGERFSADTARVTIRVQELKGASGASSSAFEDSLEADYFARVGFDGQSNHVALWSFKKRVVWRLDTRTRILEQIGTDTPDSGFIFANDRQALFFHGFALERTFVSQKSIESIDGRDLYAIVAAAVSDDGRWLVLATKDTPGLHQSMFSMRLYDLALLKRDIRILDSRAEITRTQLPAQPKSVDFAGDRLFVRFVDNTIRLYGPEILSVDDARKASGQMWNGRALIVTE